MATAPAPTPAPAPADPPAPDPEADLLGYTGSTFDPSWRSALDDPKHPLHHLRDA